MRSPPFHPDQLVPDSEVGPWRVVASLGAGGFGRVFKVERGGRFYSLKMALRPAGPHAAEEEDVNGRLAHEVASLLACAPHPNLPRLHAVDRWPEPPDGYLYFVTDYVDGETFHEWRWRVKPTAAHLLSVFTEVVRVVADLHRRGMHHRDLKGDNLLIRREDERPFLIDLGTVRMPGATTLTVGVAPASPHLLPPECVAFLREGSWQQGAHFDAGVPGDLYALGALLYEALTDGYAFDPKLPYDRLLPAIETVMPRAPHVVNPKVPRTLSDVAMRLLEKRPEDRYPGTEALLQALWDVAKEKRQPAWRVSLDRPPEMDSQSAGSETPRVRMMPELGRAPLEALKPPESSETTEPEPAPVPATLEPQAAAFVSGPELPPQTMKGEEVTPSSSPRGRHRAVVGFGLGVLLVLGFVAFALPRLSQSPGGAEAPVPPPSTEKGNPAVTSRPPSLPDTNPVATVPPATDAGGGPDAGLLASARVTNPAEGDAVTPPPPRRPGSSRAAKAAAAAACVGLGAACASAPEVRIHSPEKPCAPEVVESMMKLGFIPPNPFANPEKVAFDPDALDENVPAPPDGPLTLYVFNDIQASWGQRFVIPAGSRLRGQAFRGKDSLYGWITEAVTPDGKRYPLCVNVVTNELRYDLGQPYEASSTPDRPMVRSRVRLASTKNLGRLK
ncbi:serine/threonine protein kinase [Pyxidicoccus sp. MSG2]|uniref:serine/threonine protein kinase n=1 Tax=Pyxidicoccus sp. MSG2 TaxID=2996790 RepID=UPI00226E2018|nr:serine/threonine protein kinase [Pyxidicoccus sp. MSG2]MCY1015500.1 protein kinase [Pyxidicoccus sp. MSG2]